MPGADPDSGRLFEMNPTGRFSDRADNYAKFRPSYPPQAISFILDAFLPRGPQTLTAADIGAGTGIFSRLLADRGVRVIAIEPNASMRDAAAPHPRVEHRDAGAEATGLADASVDLITCAQAFHWFRHDKALQEFRRILRTASAGRVSIIWNDRDAADPLTAAYGELILEASNHHPAAIDRGDGAQALESSPLFTNVRKQVFRYEQPLTLEGLIGRAQSSSYCPNAGPKLDALIEGLTDLHGRFADLKGIVRMVYCTRVYIAEPAP
jgi:SAM-dependent methyltransferase